MRIKIPSSIFVIDLRTHSLRLGFDYDVYFCSWFQAYLIAVRIREGVFDSKFLIKGLGSLDGNLRSFGSLKTTGLMIFSTVPTKVVLGFSVIGGPL